MIVILDVFGVSFLGRSLNKALLDPLQSLRQRGLKVYFASNMGTPQRHLFWDIVGLRRYGEAIFCSGDLNVAKPEPAFYSRVAERVGADPDSLLFFDDSAANVDAARQCGWHAALYEDTKLTLQEIETHYGF